MLAVGDQIPDAKVWLAPREPISLRELVEEGPVLIVFYLFDWPNLMIGRYGVEVHTLALALR